MKKRISFLTAVAVFAVIVFSALILSSCECKHEYVLSSVTAPTCTEDGYTTYICSKCGDTYNDDIVPALGHDYDAVVTDPTCTDGGFTTHTCSRCGDTYTDSETEALGHDYIDTVTDPTCTEGGYTTHVCSRCDDTYTDSETEALGHDYDSVVTAPTCTEGGFTTHTCSRCGDTYTDSETEALGHDYDSVVTAPTCTDGGFTTHTCSRCGDTYTDSETEALGHDYIKTVISEATGVTSGMYQFKCSHCGDAYTEKFSPTPMSSEDIYALASKSVCEILTYDKDFEALSLGSGFVISEDGQIVTNFHVIDEAYSIKVVLGGKTYIVSQVLACDEDIDLAVLKINATGLTPVKMLKETPVGGWTVYAFGSPEGLTASMTKGVISSPSRMIDGVECIQHDASISSGSSGGPLYNEYGEVLGVNSFTIVDGNNINFAVSVKELDKLDYSSPMNMEQFYEAHGPYYEVFIYDRRSLESEPNNTIATAKPWFPTTTASNGTIILGSNGSTIRGSVNRSTDYDYYTVEIAPGEMVTALMIPDYAADAYGIALCLVDSNNNVIARGALVTIDGVSAVLFTYTNDSLATVRLYVVTTYYSDYQYRNTVGYYDLFIYVK